MSTPCKDCQDRVLGCHSTCEKYIEFSKNNNKLYEERLIEQRLKSFVFDNVNKKYKEKHKRT